MFSQVAPQGNIQQQFHLLDAADEELEDRCTARRSQAMGESSPMPTILPWHGDGISYVPGLDSLTKLYWVWHEAQSVPDSTFGGPEEALNHHQNAIQHVIDFLPRELRWRGGLSRPLYVTQGHESQTANIFISSLHLRSSLLQVYQQRLTYHIRDSGEHQKIIDDLLEILYHLPPPVFYANGMSLMPKIRGIGSAYLEEMEGHIHQEQDVVDRMARLSRKLNDLDCWTDIPHPPAPMEAQ